MNFIESIKHPTLGSLKFIVPICLFLLAISWFTLSSIVVIDYKIESGPIVSEVMGTGTLEARVSTTISPKISGKIEEVLFDQGDKVKSGDLLVRLDDSELIQQVAIAKANLEASKAALKRLEIDKDRATAVVIQARKLNQRRQILLTSKNISKEEADIAIESLGVAEAGLSYSGAAIIEGQKQLVAAEKTLEFHRARLADTRIIAPFDGIIVRRQRESGDVVVPGSSILSLISMEELWIKAWVDETSMEKLANDQKARVVFRSEPDVSYTGTVSRMGKETDRETREFVVDVRILQLPNNWAVGQRAEVFIDSARKDSAIILPVEFLQLVDLTTGVFVNEDGYAKWQKVEIGLRSQTQIEIISGLEVGQTVVIPKDERGTLSNGRKVTVQ